MILTLLNIADYLPALGILDRSHIYCGKMPDKKEKCICVYNLSGSREKRETIGGDQNSSYRVKPVSLLVHWDKSSERTEIAADKLYEAVGNIKNADMEGKRVLFARLLTDSPVDVGTDENDIYEMVIEAEFYYERKERKENEV
ncbi:MAG: minor capsid protein [Lachnospiraceae bacterium]|nr:minor capsid protein [Lachnospiraceae bacterium]